MISLCKGQDFYRLLPPLPPQGEKKKGHSQPYKECEAMDSSLTRKVGFQSQGNHLQRTECAWTEGEGVTP